MNKFKGNQKHLTLSQRIDIEKGLNDGLSFAEIARITQKDASTISKEVRKHSSYRVKNDNHLSIPCAKKSNCNIRYLCGWECGIVCKICRKKDIT